MVYEVKLLVDRHRNVVVLRHHASSMVDQFTKGQLSLDIWVLMELGLSLNQGKSARKRKQEIVEIS